MITLKSHYQPSVNKRLLNGGQYSKDYEFHPNTSETMIYLSM